MARVLRGMRRVWTIAGIGIAVLCAAATPAAASDVTLYAETVVVGADGSASVAIDLVLPAGLASPVWLPVDGGPIANVIAASPPGASAAAADRDGQLYVVLAWRDPIASATDARVTFDRPGWLDLSGAPLPHDNRRVRYRFVNLTGARVGLFSATIVLPPRFDVVSVDDVVPAVTESTVSLPYALGARDGRRTVVMTVPGLAAGGTVSVTCRVRPSATPTWLLVAIGVLGVAYLVACRDLVRRRDAA